MNREEKLVIIEDLKTSFSSYDNFYIADASTLTVEHVNNLRRICFEKGVKYQVVKNSLIKKAFEALETDKYNELLNVLSGPTSLFFAEVGNVPAKVIKDFRKQNEKPKLKAAYIDTAVFFGEESFEALVSLKTKNELIGEIIGLLQSPAKNVIGALQSGGHKLSGILKTLSDKTE